MGNSGGSYWDVSQKPAFSLGFGVVWRRGRQNKLMLPLFAYVPRSSRNACATGASCTLHVTRGRPNSRAIFTQIWAGVWSKRFDGRLSSIGEASKLRTWDNGE